MKTIETKLQKNLNKIEKWTVENGFKFSMTKTNLAPATRGLRNWWLPSPLWHMGGKSPQKQRRPIIIEQN